MSKVVFGGAGLISHNPDTILSKLDMKLRTPIPFRTANGLPEYWVSKIPKITNKVFSQSTFIKGQIAKHQESSPTFNFAAVDQLSKGLQLVSYKLALVQAEI
jgi:hypothetical protein